MSVPVPQSPGLKRPADPAWSPEHTDLLSHLRAAVLLGGSVRPTQLRKAIGRFVLDLPVTHERSVLDCWRDQMLALAEAFRLPQLPVRIMVDPTTPPARRTDWPGPTELRIERDPLEFRGTGGLLRDLAADYDDQDLILVASAAQIPLEPLPAVVDALAGAEGDVRILALQDGTPTGMMLVRCGALRNIPKVGFIDLKEQALPAIAKNRPVIVVRRDRPAGLPVRTLADYLEALRAYHRRQQGLPDTDGAFAEDWRPTFRIIEPGAEVDPSAVVHDSIVLAGGVVESVAVLVRSVVCPGGRLGVGRSAVDRLVTEGEQEWV